MILRVIGLAVLLAAPASAQVTQNRPALPGGLEVGPHPVGFRVIQVSDATRISGPRVDAGKRTPGRARTFDLHVWYPAAPGAAGTPLSVGDYIAAAGPAAQTHRQDMPRTVGITLTDEEWTQYTSTRLTAVRDAAPAPGPFPLIVGTLRPVSVVLTAEHLASHGYVVAYAGRQPRESFIADGLVREALIIGEMMRDLDVATARLRTEPFVDGTRLGAHGFSGDGLAPMAWSMRHPDVDAVALLETGWLSPAQVSSFQELPDFDPLAQRAAVFYAYSENLGRNSLEHIATLTGMRYAPRSLFYLGEPRMTHWDFATEGIVLAQTMARRAQNRAALTRVYHATYRAQRNFFDAWVKGDQAARTRLGEVPVAASGGALLEMTALPAITPALSRAELQAQLERDVAGALAQARTDLARDPKAPVFDAAWLNTTGYAYFQRGQREHGLALIRLATEAYPRSANSLDSLSEMLEATNQRAEALAAAEKALALLPGDTTVPAAQRAPLEAGLKARITRLR